MSDLALHYTDSPRSFRTEYRSEIWYPDYFDSARPDVAGIPSSISYGGDAFDLEVSGVTLGAAELGSIQIRLIRTGFCEFSGDLRWRKSRLTPAPFLGAATHAVKCVFRCLALLWGRDLTTPLSASV